MIKIFFCIGLLLSIAAKAKPVAQELTGPWVLHFKYTSNYKQRSRITSIHFNTQGDCGEDDQTKCVLLQNEKELSINYYLKKDGTWQKSNTYQAEDITEKRISGSIYSEPNKNKLGDWLMVRSDREANMGSITFTSLWDKWNLHYNLLSNPVWVVLPLQMLNDSKCLFQDKTYPCIWTQLMDSASFWLPVANQDWAYFKTSDQPIVYNPNGLIYSPTTNEKLGSWFLSP